MTREEIKSKVSDILVTSMDLKIDPSEIQGKNLIQELGINSVDTLEIFVRIENTFEIQIDDEDLNSQLIESLDSISNYIYKKKND